MIGYQQRFAAAAVQARAVLASGVLGRIASATARWNRRMAGGGLWDRGAWFLDPAQGGGGPFIDIGVHKLDLCLDLLGYPRIRRLVAKSRHGLGVRAAAARGCDYRIEDALDAWLFADDLDIRVEASYFRNQEQEEYHDVELIGERGGLRIDAGGLRAWTVAADGAIAPLPPPAAAATGAVGHFADVLAGRTPLRPTPEQSLALQGIVDACYRSAGSGSGLIPLGDAEAMP
jgi:predicted dehydrogenase